MTLSVAELHERLSAIPRLRLCELPTPLQAWPRLAEQWCSGAQIAAKRDDLTGPGFGGNKSRQLEFLLGDAVAAGADTVVHGGAVQSNYCRQLSAAAAALGLGCHLVLSTAYSQPLDQGCHLMDQLFGARITLVDCPLGEEHERRKAEVAERLRDRGHRPYLITYPHSEILGSMGYLLAAAELVDQLEAWSGASPNQVVTSAVGATYAGLLLGLRLLGCDLPVIGIAPLHAEYDVVSAVGGAMRAAADRLGVRLPDDIIDAIDIRVDHVGAGGYAVPTRAGMAALSDTARLQGVLLDPVYTSKAAAGLRSLLRPGRTSVFVHTGGAVAGFAYAPAIVAALEVARA